MLVAFYSKGPFTFSEDVCQEWDDFKQVNLSYDFFVQAVTIAASRCSVQVDQWLDQIDECIIDCTLRIYASEVEFAIGNENDLYSSSSYCCR
uniref:Uncharacterized protein n=1 Tax=Romanomermis culicivorax TaxID=13658 RepID=A0A915JV27_ROMCU